MWKSETLSPLTSPATVVTPLLRKYGDTASFYVSAGFIGDGAHANWAQLRAMRAAGMEIGCHGTHHLDLTRRRESFEDLVAAEIG